MDLDNLAIMSVASRVKNYPLIEEVNLSDNKVTNDTVGES